ncbi:L,D-transpeptidase family protein [Paracoccus sp. TK19116]|uniref:L,D-transpeptidase family protein n=1 Tax=Paracoccus albicereus TaxID=2922394 RepID=A0ABT1MPX1_9RHOB|nr:L,D-transpeptidase family protein [Paracoccus albicereus]MCQ0969754.1 L,D-transpeptidase family protein [Paracoccus albicereus]
MKMGWQGLGAVRALGLVATLSLTSGMALAQGGPAPAVAQVAASTAVAPRLSFTADEMALARAVADEPALANFYGQNGLKPIFSGPGSEARRAAVIAAIATARDHGLPPARYGADALQSADPSTIAGEVMFARAFARWADDLSAGILKPASVDPGIKREVKHPSVARLMREFTSSGDPAAVLAAIAPRDPRYIALQRTLADRGRLTAPEGTPLAPAGLWRVGARDPRLGDLRLRLSAMGFQTAPTSDTSLYDDGLSDAVMRFQKAAGLPSDGVAGPRTIERLNGGADQSTRMIMVAMERMRWMAVHDLNARHVWVNIPEFNARIMDGGTEVFITRTVVGKTDPTMRTPEFSDEMEHVVVNPRWNVPRSITVKEYLPRLKANRNAVAHLDVVDSRGNVIPRGNINFAQYSEASFPYRMRQKPSSDNALGLVKFIFPNPWNIYLHDTPTKHLFGERTRSFSHGCVRVGDPFDLATALLSQQSSDPRGVFERALASGRETFLELTPHLPVHLVYFTAFPDESGEIRFYGDVYGRDARVWDALAKAGLESDAKSD